MTTTVILTLSEENTKRQGRQEKINNQGKSTLMRDYLGLKKRTEPQTS